MRRVVAYAAVLGLTCSTAEPAKPVLPLDERLPAGRARAGVITRAEELLTGDTAKGRIGDFKLYNDRVAIVIAQLGFGGYQPFGGIILDADRVRPAGEKGRSTFGEVVAAFDLMIMKPASIEVVNDGSDGTAAVVRVTGEGAEFPLFSAILGAIISREVEPIGMVADYVLAPDKDWVEINYKITNPLRGNLDVGLPLTGYLFGDGAEAFTVGAGFATPEAGVSAGYYGASGPNVTYLYGRPDEQLTFILGVSGLLLASAGDSFTLRGKESTTIRHVLVIGDGDLPRAQELWQQAATQPPLAPLIGRVVDVHGAPVANARVHVTRPEASNPDYDYVTLARTNAQGEWRAMVPGGEPYEVVAVTDGLVRSSPRRAETLNEPVTLSLDRPGTVRYGVTEGTRPLPAKLTFVRAGSNDALPRRFGEALQPSGVLRVEYGYTGVGSVELPAGAYRVSISRGTEYEVVERDITVVADQTIDVTASLLHSVDTTGFMATDTHIHAQASPDCPDLYPFKVASMVVEQLEIPVSTEHEWLGDFNPAIRAMGLERWIHGIVGTEVTTFAYGHFNAFPMTPDFTKPGNGRVDWIGKDPKDTFAAIRANPGDPFLQVNHPRSAAIGGYFAAMGFDNATFTADAQRWSLDFDGIEVANECPVETIEATTMPDWFSFLNRGMKRSAMGSTDSHHAGKGEMGYPKTFLMMPTDLPSEAKIDDVRAAAKAGRAVVSCGPFLDLAMGTSRVGDTATLTGDRVEVVATVRAPSWIQVSQVELLVNGEVKKIAPIPAVDGPLDVRVTMTASVTAGRDAWVIARARGPKPVNAKWAPPVASFAFTNAIYIDGDRDGTWTMVR